MASAVSDNKISIRLPDDLRQRLSSEADQRFDGQDAVAARRAIKIYLDLRDALGPQFEPTLDVLTRTHQPK